MSSELWSCASRFELVRLDRPQWRSIVQRFVSVCSEVWSCFASYIIIMRRESSPPSTPPVPLITAFPFRVVIWCPIHWKRSIQFARVSDFNSCFSSLTPEFGHAGYFFYLFVCLSSFITNEKVKFALIHFVFLITLEKCWHVGFPLSSQMNMDPTVQKWGMSKARAQKRYYIDIKVFPLDELIRLLVSILFCFSLIFCELKNFKIPLQVPPELQTPPITAWSTGENTTTKKADYL